MTLQICIFAKNENDFNNALELLQNINLDFLKIFFCSSAMPRSYYLNKYSNGWILFLDADCELSQASWSLVNELVENKKHDEDTVIAGSYSSAAEDRIIQRAHNWVANAWVESFGQIDILNPVVLGGIFLINTKKLEISPLSETDQNWGAEDKILSQQLLCRNYHIIFDDQLKVAHKTTSSWAHFFRRAWYQGLNDQQKTNRNLSINEFLTKLKYWILKLFRTEPALIPAVLLHFLILWLGRSVQQLRQRSN